MKIKAVKDSIGGYRVWGTDIIWARQNECRCCWYVFDDLNVETLGYAQSYAQAKEMAFKFAIELESADA